MLGDGQVVALRNIPRDMQRVRTPLVGLEIDVKRAIAAERSVALSVEPPTNWRWSRSAWLAKRDNAIRSAYSQLGGI